MSTTLGKFLMNGIQFRRNFIGKQTLQTSSYTLLECTVKVLPFIFVYKNARKLPPTTSDCVQIGAQRDHKIEIIEEGVAPAEVRRSSLTE